MHRHLLSFLRCPTCGGSVELESLGPGDGPAPSAVSDGLLRCAGGHRFPIVRGIPRMLPAAGYDSRTRESFGLEWEHYEPGGRTWGIELGERVRKYFLEPVRIPGDQLAGRVLLDAGCGNGSQSVAYGGFGLEVIAMDLSSGLEHGQALLDTEQAPHGHRVHFVQADLQCPPLAPSSVDIIHSAGVLHHTPDTEATFRTLCRLLRPGGTFYVWLYKYEPVVTPIVNGIRTVTTRIPPTWFALAAQVLAGAFQLFCIVLDRLGIRKYPRLSRREAALALIDIFGAPYAHYHDFPEVARWFADEGFTEVWPCNDDRRGFGVCGRRGGTDAAEPVDAVSPPDSPG